MSKTAFPLTVAEFSRGENEVLRLNIDLLGKNTVVVDLRVWWMPENRDDFLPTKRGCGVALHKLPDLAAAFAKAEAVAVEAGLLAPSE